MKHRLILLSCLLLIITGCGSPSEQAGDRNVPENTSISMKQVKQLSSSAQPNYLNAGIAQLQEGNVVEAIKSFDEAIKADPANPEGYMILGQTYMRLGDYSRAIDTFSAALRVAPNVGQIHYMLAVNYGLYGQPTEAIASAERSAEIFRQQKDQDNFLKSVALLQGLANAEESGELSERDVADTDTP